MTKFVWTLLELLPLIGPLVTFLRTRRESEDEFGPLGRSLTPEQIEEIADALLAEPEPDFTPRHVDVVRQVVRTELRSEGKRNLWISLAQNTLFFGLGVAVTLLVS
jgi:hypothetical protein